MQRHALLLVVAAGLCLGACGERTEVAPAAKVTAPAAAPAAPTAAALAEGITFANAALPDFVAKTQGISQPEPFGRWTEGPVAAIDFGGPLPTEFDLVIRGAAHGPNVNQPVKVTIGTVTKEFSFPSDMSTDPQVRRLTFKLPQAANRIEFAIPKPARPAGNDIRELGLALVSLKLEPVAAAAK